LTKWARFAVSEREAFHIFPKPVAPSASSLVGLVLKVPQYEVLDISQISQMYATAHNNANHFPIYEQETTDSCPFEMGSKPDVSRIMDVCNQAGPNNRTTVSRFGHDLTKWTRFVLSKREVFNLCPDPVALGANSIAGIDMRVPQHEMLDVRP
jgi:hypothetical protein